MSSTLMHKTPATGLGCYAAIAPSLTATHAGAPWTGLSFAAGTAVLPAAADVVAGVRNVDLPGSPPRGAPV